MSDDTWIDLRAHGKMFGQISHDGRWLCFKRRGMVVVFDVQETVRRRNGVQTNVPNPIEIHSRF